MLNYSAILEKKLEKVGAIRLSNTVWEIPQRPNTIERWKKIEGS